MNQKRNQMIAASNGVTSAILGSTQIEKTESGDANIVGDVETTAINGEVVIRLKGLGITYKLDPKSAVEHSQDLHKNAATARRQIADRAKGGKNAGTKTR